MNQSFDPRSAGDEARGEALVPNFVRGTPADGLLAAVDTRMEPFFEAALAGTLPRLRRLRYWEPDTLNAQHLQIIMMKACGFSQTRIARLLGVTDGYISITVNHPDAQYLLAKMLSYAADKVIDIDARMDAMLPEALDILADVMRDDKTAAALRTKVAFGMLDRRGYGVIERKTVVSTTVNVAPEQAGLLTAAIGEARELVGVNYRVYVNAGEARGGEALAAQTDGDEVSGGSDAVDAPTDGVRVGRDVDAAGEAA